MLPTPRAPGHGSFYMVRRGKSSLKRNKHGQIAPNDMDLMLREFVAKGGSLKKLPTPSYKQPTGTRFSYKDSRPGEYVSKGFKQK